MHAKTDFTKLGAQEGYVTVYLSGGERLEHSAVTTPTP